MAFSDVRLADIQQLKASGLKDLDARGVMKLARDPYLKWSVTTVKARAP